MTSDACSDDLEWLDKMGDHFEAAWKAGESPKIENYLQVCRPDLQTPLLHYLASIELELRRASGEAPTSEEYAQRFPEHATFFITQSFLAPDSIQNAPVHSANGRKPADKTKPKFSFGIPGYEIKDVIGEGAMGTVYLACQLELNRPVAIKVLLPGCSDRRFRREASLVGRISSSHVVSVHDLVQIPNGQIAIVMEYVDGTDLLGLMKRRGGMLGEAEALQLMREVCLGMTAAANEGIVHRDLKPRNILISGQGHAKIADFGLARGADSSGDLTRDKPLIGTPLYMAPEQAEDPQLVDARADVYSFGATFYHALTGSPPFEGETEFSVLFKHKTELLTSPRARNPLLSESTSEVLERCLAKKAGDRFRSFEVTLKALEGRPGHPSPWEITSDVALQRQFHQFRAKRDEYLSARRPRLLDVFHFHGDRQLLIKTGDLVREDVDAIVNSTAAPISLNFGVSRSIGRAGGQSVREQVKLFSNVRPGRVAVTSGGNLKAKFIFHGITLGYSQAETSGLVFPSRDLIIEIIDSCFFHADSLGVNTISFPLLGAGAAKFPEAHCLDAMFQTLARRLQTGVTGVKEVRIVLFEGR